MQWTDVTVKASPRVLRQFAALLMLFSAVAAGWRALDGRADIATWLLAGAGFVLGTAGLVRPRIVGPVFRGAMILSFPIGWLGSRVALALVFYVVITPFAVVFRLAGRDPLRRRRTSRASSWEPKPGAENPPERYLRQF